MSSIGEALRRERIRQGLDLEQVSRETKIGVQLLSAIESDQFDKLPGGVFTRSFVRQYARALGMDDREIESELREVEPVELPVPVFSSSSRSRVPPLNDLGARLPSNSSLTSLALVVLVILACSGIYALWQKGTRAPAANASAVQPAPAATPATPPSAKVETPPAPAPPPQAARTGELEIAISATEPAWISVTSAGKSLYEGTLQASESKTFTAPEHLKVVFGNAGGVAVAFNGKPMGAPGPKGQVRILEAGRKGVHVRTPSS